MVFRKPRYPGYYYRLAHGGRSRVVGLDTTDKTVAELIEGFAAQLRHDRRWDVIDGILDRKFTLPEAYDHRAKLDQWLATRTEVDLDPLVTRWNGRGKKVRSEKYITQVRAFIPAGVRFPLSRFRRREIAAFLEGLDVSDPTRNRYKAALSQFAAWLVRHEYLDANPVREAGTFSERAPRTVHLSPEDAKAVVDRMTGEAKVVAALMAGTGPALMAAVLGLLAHQYLVPGYAHAFHFDDANDDLTLGLFLAVALLAANRIERIRDQAEDWQRREAATAALYSFSRKLAGVGAVDDLLWAVAHQIASMLHVRVLLLLPGEDGTLGIRAGYPPDDELGESEWAAAQWAWDHKEPAGRGSDTLATALHIFLPLRTVRGAVGVIGIEREGNQSALLPEERRLLDALADQAAMAIERLNLTEESDEARMAAATERLRSALLASISHDLRTPMASILTAVTALTLENTGYEETTRRQLLLSIEEEALRLNRFVGSLLDMTRLESGGLAVARGPVDLADVIGDALRREQPILAQHEVRIDLAPAMPVLELDFVLFEQVLAHILDNAAQYSPPGSTITIRAEREAAELAIEITDEGFGIAPEDLELIFDKFYRVHVGDRRRAGIGLGLSISRGLVEAQGGRILARSAGIGFGTTIRVTFAIPAGAATLDSPPSMGNAA